MHIAEFKRLCASYDSILVSFSADHPEVAAVSSFHVLNGHPSDIKRCNPSRARPYFLLVKFILFSALNFVKSIFSSRSVLLPYPKLDPDVVIFSHLLNPDQLNTPSDFYYGDLTQALASAGRTTVSVLINHTIYQPAKLWSNPKAITNSRVPIVRLLTPLQELYISFKQIQLFLLLLSSPIVRQQSLSNLAFDALSSGTSANLRFYIQVSLLLKNYNLTSIVVTFEGHAWERLAFYAARKANPKVLCVGYQHTFIFPMQHSIKRSLGPSFDPDTILFSGDHGLEWFQNNSDYKPHLFVVGTPRFDSIVPTTISSLRFDPSNPSCLLLPDGTLSESLAFFRFGLLCSIKLRHINFVIRLHPVLNLHEILNEDRSLREMPSNFHISSQSIQSDFLTNRWALYRGSGAGVRAATTGLRPIFYNHSPSDISIDPLHMLTSWRREASSVDDIATIFNSDLATSPISIDEEYLTVCHEIATIFRPLNLDSFIAHV